MELDTKLDSEDESKRGPCPFFGVEEGLFFCEIGGEVCNHNDHVSSRCGKYWMLGDKLIHQIRAKCVTCQRVEFDGKWFKPEEIVIPQSNNSIPLDIWEEFAVFLPMVFCPDCQPKKPESQAEKGEKD